MATQAIVTLNPIVRGNTMRARVVTFSVNASAPTITEASWNLSGLLALPCEVNGDKVTIPKVSKDITTRWPEGTRDWDLSIVVAGDKRTYIRGTIPVLPSED